MSTADSHRPSRLGANAAEIFAAEVAEAERDGARGYMTRVLAQVTLPHSRPVGNEYIRRNGSLTLSMWSPPHIGLPYAGVPRLLLAWITTEAVRTKERQLILGNSLTDFMAQLGMVPTGGRWGSIPRLQNQMHRLLASTVVCTYDDNQQAKGTKLDVASEYQLWWATRRDQVQEGIASKPAAHPCQ